MIFNCIPKLGHNYHTFERMYQVIHTSGNQKKKDSRRIENILYGPDTYHLASRLVMGIMNLFENQKTIELSK